MNTARALGALRLLFASGAGLVAFGAGSLPASGTSGFPDQPGAAAGSAAQAADPYERGQEMIEAGNPEGALILWVALQDSLWAAGAEDPRIGVAFMQTAVEHGFDTYQEVATQIFYWAFSGRQAGGETASSEILAEGRRTFLLTDSVIAQYWLGTGRNDPAVLARAIKRFWIERDPTPTTPLNERLVEHWERIVHARRNYVYNYSSPYRTDDRGTFYVKYGEPDRITAGTLTISAFDLQYRDLSVEDVVSVDLNPRYEIWRYANIEPPDFTYFLFGNVDQTGPFRYVKGLDAILGPSARTTRINGIRAQYYLELFYYIELGKMGGPYGSRLADLEMLWGQARQPNEGTLEAASVRYSTEDTWEAQRSKRPAHSPFDDSRKSALSAQLVRTLVDNEPRLLVLAVSSPLWRPAVDRDELEGGISLAPYSASHTVVVRDRDLNEVGRASMEQMSAEGDVSSLEMRHAIQIGHLTVAAEHVIQGQDLEDAEEVGVLPGHTHFAVAPPLRRDAVQLEISDMIVGISPETVTGAEAFPMPVLPATQFWRDDPVRVYFEIYHPSGLDDGTTGSFDVRILIVPFLGTATPEELARSEAGGRAAITLTIESGSPTGRHHFDLDLRNERPGLQQIVLEVTDPVTGARRTRAIPITLLAN